MSANKKTTELPRVLSVKPVSKISNIPRILPTIPVSMGKSGVRPQTPYDDKTSQPYTNIRPATPRDKKSRTYTDIRPATPHPRKKEALPEFTSNLQNERTQDLTYFLNEINNHGGKYSKKKVVKKSKCVVKKSKCVVKKAKRVVKKAKRVVKANKK
jgi:hypothetical protein